jgi:hypothetical protein
VLKHWNLQSFENAPLFIEKHCCIQLLHTSFSLFSCFLFFKSFVHITILDCSFNKISDQTQWFDGENNIQISRTTFTNCQSSIRFNLNSVIVLNECHFKNIKSQPIETYRRCKIQILNSTFSKTNSIYFDECDGINVENCIFKNSKQCISISNCLNAKLK